jgi:AraC-like DNA-binding protein
MSVIQVCFLFAGISFCLAFIVFSRSIFKQLSLRYFLVYLVLVAVIFGFRWLLVHPETPYKAAWYSLLMASSFLLAPCVWLFAQEIDNNSPPKLWPIAWGQSAFVLLGFILCIPLFLAAHESTLLVDPSRPRTSLSNLIHETMVAAVVLYLIQVPWYLSRCLSLFKERMQTNKLLFSTIDEPALNALRALIWIMAANWLINLARMLQVMIFDPSQAWYLFATACEVVVVLVALYVIFERCWQFNLNDQTIREQLVTEETAANQNENTEKYAKSSLDTATRTRVRNKIVAEVEEKQLFKKSGLKLQDLCEATGERAHYISQVINQDLNMSFFDFINQHRIEAAKLILKEFPSRSVLDVALEVGFNSKSTFNKVFKERVGQTPSEYRYSVAKD